MKGGVFSRGEALSSLGAGAASPFGQAPRPALTNDNPIVMQYVDANTTRVWVKSDSAYVMLLMAKGSGTATLSEGVNYEFWRCTTVEEAQSAYVSLGTTPTKGTNHVSGTHAWTSTSLSLTGTAGNRTVPYSRSTQPGDYLEWTGIVGPTISIGFVASGTPAATKIYVDGALVETYTNAGSGGSILRREITTTAGSHTLRLEHAGASGAFCYVIAPNFFPLESALPGLAYDALYYGQTPATYPAFVTSTGAHEYAVSNADSATWAGTYHGGETALAPAVWTLDGSPVTLASGDIEVGDSLTLEQSTRLAWAATPAQTLDTSSTFTFHDKGLHFACSVSGTVNAGWFHTHMTPTSTSFSMVAAPFDGLDASGSDPRIVSDEITLGRCSRVVQKHPTSGRTVTSWWTLHSYVLSAHGGAYVALAPGNYHKVYYGLCDGQQRIVTAASWESVWLF